MEMKSFLSHKLNMSVLHVFIIKELRFNHYINLLYKIIYLIIINYLKFFINNIFRSNKQQSKHIEYYSR